MVDSSTILKAVALPTSHTPSGIFKLELTCVILVLGVLIATYGFRRWYTIMYEDWKLKEAKDEILEQRLDLLSEIKEDTRTEDQKWQYVDMKIPFNEEDYGPPMRSRIVNYIIFFLGMFMFISGFVIWLVLPS